MGAASPERRYSPQNRRFLHLILGVIAFTGSVGTFRGAFRLFPPPHNSPAFVFVAFD